MSLLISSIFGFLTSQIPAVWNFFQDKRDKEHELALFDKQIEVNKLTHEREMRELEMPAVLGEQEAIYNIHTNIKWVDAFNGSIRGIIALGLFLTYVFSQIIYSYMFMNDPSIPAFVKVDELMTDEDYSFLGIVIGYYFGKYQSKK